MKRLASAVVLVLGLAWSRPADASTRLAVFVVADDAPLSDNLTEVAIARLAEKPGYELIGLRELADRLNELSTVKSEGLRACLAHPACLVEVGATAGVESAIVGDVRRDADHYALDLMLVDARSGTSTKRLPRASPLDLDHLISAVQSGVFELVPDASAPATPSAREESPPSATPSTHRRTDQAPRPKDVERTSLVPYIAYGSAALAVVAFSAAAVTGALATESPPPGSSRAEVQADLEKRKGYATTSNALLVTGGVLATTAVVTFVVPW
jgi:hypothetical protein